MEQTLKTKDKLIKFIENMNLLFFILFLVWYILPILKVYLSGSIFNIIMTVDIIMFFITSYILAPEKFLKLGKHTIIVIVCVLCYLLNIFFRGDIGNPIAFAKIGIIFWIPVIMTNLAIHYYTKEKKNFIIKAIMFCFIITLIPTLIALTKDNSIVRSMAYGGIDTQEDIENFRNNVGGFSFLYGLVVFIPILIYLLKEEKNKIFLFILLLAALITLIKGSFSIAIIIVLLSVGTLIFNYYKKRTSKVLIIFMLLLVLILTFDFAPNILNKLSKYVENPYIKTRIIEVSNFLDNADNAEGDLAGRFNLYGESLNTFIQHPLIGVGGYYYIENNNPGIGYHSQIFDDMARYGITSLIFVVLFFYEYRKSLINISTKKENKIIINTALVSVLSLAVLNPCFNNEWVSVILFVLLPLYCSLERGEEDEKNNSKNSVQHNSN